ncbi:MAG: Fic family protein [Bacteroidales bacterium]
MVPYKVFISSPQVEFAEERKEIDLFLKTDLLLKSFFEPIIFEKLPAASHSPNKVFLDEVKKSQIYIGLMGTEYGYEDANGVSPTEQEYDYAVSQQLERWIYIKEVEGKNRHSKEEKFIRKVASEISYKPFKTLDDLKHEIYKSCLAFLRNKGQITTHLFDDQYSHSASLEDIDVKKIQNFIRLARNKRGFPLSESSSVAQILEHLKMSKEEQVSNSAILAFGNNPQFFFPTAIVKCAHFHGFHVAKPIPDHKVYEGDVFEQVDQAVDFVLSKINISVGTRDSSNQAPTHYEIPRAAVAEAIVNAVAHRDYNSNGSVQVMLFADRLEIANPGHLVPQLSIPQLKVEHSSYPTNPKLAECLYQAGYIERFGTGTGEIFRLSKEFNLLEPTIDLTEGFKVTIWRPSAHKGYIGDRTSTGQVPDKYRTSTGQVKESVKRILLVVDGEMKSADIQNLLQLKHRETFRDNYLVPALNEGILEMTIPENPNSPKQMYRLTQKGIELQKIIR